MAPGKRQKKPKNAPPDAGKPDAEESAEPAATTGGPSQGVDFGILKKSRREGAPFSPRPEPPTPGDIGIRVANTKILCLFLRETGTQYTRTTRPDCICNSICDRISTTRGSEGPADAKPTADANPIEQCLLVQPKGDLSPCCCKRYM